MSNLDDLFLFIAYKLEKKGYDKKDIETIYGVTKKYYPEVYKKLKKDIKKDERQAILTAYHTIYDSMLYAKTLYENIYMPFSLFANYFDFAFNASEKTSAMILQESINKTIEMVKAETNILKVDGIIGKHTIKSIEDLYLLAQELFCNNMRLRRRWYMEGNKRYRCGWINRTLNLEEYLFNII